MEYKMENGKIIASAEMTVDQVEKRISELDANIKEYEGNMEKMKREKKALDSIVAQCKR